MARPSQANGLGHKNEVSFLYIGKRQTNNCRTIRRLLSRQAAVARALHVIFAKQKEQDQHRDRVKYRANQDRNV